MNYSQRLAHFIFTADIFFSGDFAASSSEAIYFVTIPFCPQFCNEYIIDIFLIVWTINRKKAWNSDIKQPFNKNRFGFIVFNTREWNNIAFTKLLRQWIGRR